MKLFGSTDLLDTHGRATVLRETQPYWRTYDGSVGERRAHNGGGGDGRRSLAGTAAAWPPLGELIQRSAEAVGTSRRRSGLRAAPCTYERAGEEMSAPTHGEPVRGRGRCWRAQGCARLGWG